MYILLDYTLYSWKKRGGNMSPPTGPKTCSCHAMNSSARLQPSPSRTKVGGTLLWKTLVYRLSASALRSTSALISSSFRLDSTKLHDI